MTKATSGTMVSGSSLYSWVEVTNGQVGDNTVTFDIRGGVESDYYWDMNCTTYLQGEEGGTTYNITSGSGHFSGYYTMTLASTSDYFTRQTSARSVKLKAYSTCSSGSATASLSYTVPAKNVTDLSGQTYTIIYNTLGGVGGPPSQTKVYNTNITLSTLIPTKAGYVFNGGNTKKDGTGTSYAAGATYSANSCVVLFAKGSTTHNSSPLVTTTGCISKNTYNSSSGDEQTMYICKDCGKVYVTAGHGCSDDGTEQEAIGTNNLNTWVAPTTFISNPTADPVYKQYYPPKSPNFATVTLDALQTFGNGIKQRFLPTDMQDYIVDMGGSGNGIGIKGNSGRAECGGNYYNQYPITSSGGSSLYESSAISGTFPSGLFNSTPRFCHTAFNPASGSYFVFGIENGPDLSSTTTQKVMLLRPTSNSSNVKGDVQFYAVGTGK